MNFKEFQEFCLSLIPEIKGTSLKYFRNNFVVDLKEDNSPVTIADKLIEESIRNKIGKLFPEHGICGEEFGNENEGSSFEWIIDPIDGTKSFISGVPLFSTLVGFLFEGSPLFGFIYNPIVDDIAFGDNETCIGNGIRTNLRNCNSLSDAVVVSTDHIKIEKFRDKKGFDNLINKTKFYRSWGDAYGYLILALGSVDIMVDPKMSRWDIMPIIPVMRGAGAKITDYYGNNPELGDSIVACHPNFHEDVISCLNGI